MKERSREGLHAKPRKDKDKKPRKPHRYRHEGSGPGKVRRYMCPVHDRWHTLTTKEIAGERPVKCTGHEVTIDFRMIDRIMLRS